MMVTDFCFVTISKGSDSTTLEIRHRACGELPPCCSTPCGSYMVAQGQAASAMTLGLSFPHAAAPLRVAQCQVAQCQAQRCTSSFVAKRRNDCSRGFQPPVHSGLGLASRQRRGDRCAQVCRLYVSHMSSCRFATATFSRPHPGVKTPGYIHTVASRQTNPSRVNMICGVPPILKQPVAELLTSSIGQQAVDQLIVGSPFHAEVAA